MKKTNTIKWKCPECGKDWISNIKNIWFGRCYACDTVHSFDKSTKRKIKWKYVSDKLYEDIK